MPTTRLAARRCPANWLPSCPASCPADAPVLRESGLDALHGSGWQRRRVDVRAQSNLSAEATAVQRHYAELALLQ